MKVLSHRVRMIGNRVTIISDQHDNELTSIYGSEKVRTHLTFDRMILIELLANLGQQEIPHNAELQRLQHYLGVAGTTTNIIDNIRKNKWAYSLDAETLF